MFKNIFLRNDKKRTHLQVLIIPNFTLEKDAIPEFSSLLAVI
jgi:hypothetical protein